VKRHCFCPRISVRRHGCGAQPLPPSPLCSIPFTTLSQPICRFAPAIQPMFYGLGLFARLYLTKGMLGRIADFVPTFVFLNIVVPVAFVNFITGRKVAWSQ
jgi:hypothetical protein